MRIILKVNYLPSKCVNLISTLFHLFPSQVEIIRDIRLHFKENNLICTNRSEDATEDSASARVRHANLQHQVPSPVSF